MEDAREARRKKLMSRGTDRLAFITGQARSLPEPNPLRSPPPAGTSLAEDVAGSVTTKSQESNEISRVQPKTESSNEISKYEIEESAKHETKNQHGAVSPTTSAVARLSVEGSDQTTDTAPKTSHTIFTSRRISVSISASENIRLVCSVIVALLMVLSYHGYSLGINALGSITSFRPLLLVFLTDATVILAPLVINQANEQKGKETARGTAMEGDGSVMNIGSMLEAAMVSQKAVSAVSMDCSICAVIMICGIVI